MPCAVEILCVSNSIAEIKSSSFSAAEAIIAPGPSASPAWRQAKRALSGDRSFLHVARSIRLYRASMTEQAKSRSSGSSNGSPPLRPSTRPCANSSSLRRDVSHSIDFPLKNSATNRSLTVASLGRSHLKTRPPLAQIGGRP